MHPDANLSAHSNLAARGSVFDVLQFFENAAANVVVRPALIGQRETARAAIQ